MLCTLSYIYFADLYIYNILIHQNIKFRLFNLKLLQVAYNISNKFTIKI